jgi:class 3 adenylate cyclase
MSDFALPSMEPPPPSGERRQVTVLFADMVGFTAISERLGEEGTYALIQPIYQLMASAVKEQGGSVKDFTGDGIMALFGVPDALEDAPLRACRAALLIHERLAAAVPRIEAKHGVRPQMRIGVNSGLAVVTQIRGESAAMTALGDTVNLASRLQTLAEPGTAYLSEATQRLVHGMADTTFAGAHKIKGKAEQQNVYRLDGFRKGATRFEASVGRGLTAYVGRGREMDILENALAGARNQLRVIDVVAEPGIGKSRLLHEFRGRLGKEQAFTLWGTCSPDGQQTPFLPFIELVRNSFQVKAGEAEAEIVRKIEIGLNVLGLKSKENLGLLLNLLGLKPSQGALTGLDGVMIGLRTRDLLQNLVQARCRLSSVVLLIEDLHWIDSVSQELLGNIIDGDTNAPLLVLSTRRPEYEPRWRDNPTVTSLRLEPLVAGDVRHLVQKRLGVEALPEALIRLVIEKAEGNALFAEEILSFLTERRVLRIVGRMVEFNANAVAAALPASVQSLLTARVDRLAPGDRALLQAASVIGRRFDPEVLAIATDSKGDFHVRLGAMQALDLVHIDGKTGDYLFKHALVRDALYLSLLAGPRAALHLKIAETIELRSDNRLAEVTETLAYHYEQTDRSDKYFTYLVMSGAKSLGVYSLDEANRYFADAVALVDKNPACATDQQIVNLLVDFTLCSNLLMRVKASAETVARFLPRLRRLTDSPERVLIHHHYVVALIELGRYGEAKDAQVELTEVAALLGDARSRAYALAGAMFLQTTIDPRPLETFVRQSRDVVEAASDTADPYIQVFARFVIAWEEMYRGRMVEAQKWAQDLIDSGRAINDPRSLGFGLQLQAWFALLCDDYGEALRVADIALDVARAPFDRESVKNIKISAAVLLRHLGAAEALRAWMNQCTDNDWRHYLGALDGIWAVASVMSGDISGGILSLDESILRREREGQRLSADWQRMFLCEVYLEIISGKDKPPLRVIAYNMLTLIAVFLTAGRRINKLVDRVRQNPQLDRNGHHVGRCEMILGLLYKAKRKPPLALQHLTEAKRIVSQFGPSPMLAKIEAALVGLD